MNANMTDSSGYDRIKEHLDLYRSDPNTAHDWNPYGKVVPTLLLVSTGSKSGKLRTRPLVYGRTGSSYVVVASKGGSPKHPAWYTNLVVNPECTIQVREAVIPVRARTASGAERDRL